MPRYNEADLLNLLTVQNEEAVSIIYDIYAGAIYGTICNHVYDKHTADKILANVFIRFREEVKSKKNISEGLFICLYRISRKLVFENCEKSDINLIEPKVIIHSFKPQLAV